MSILIKGLNMPKDDCEAYRELIITNNYVGNGKIQMLAHDSITNEFIGEVVEVPEPHGRLIDADKMITRFENINDFLMGDCKFCELASSDKARVDELANCIAEIVNAPTVIEVEG